jgi:hypothetical protein
MNAETWLPEFMRIPLAPFYEKGGLGGVKDVFLTKDGMTNISL